MRYLICIKSSDMPPPQKKMDNIHDVFCTLVELETFSIHRFCKIVCCSVSKLKIYIPSLLIFMHNFPGNVIPEMK